jgi:hypothetical protein
LAGVDRQVPGLKSPLEVTPSSEPSDEDLAARSALATGQRAGLRALAQPFRDLEPIAIVTTLGVSLAVLVAYGFSLVALLRSMVLLRPTAAIGLVPVIGLGLIVGRLRARNDEPAIHDRLADYVIGLPLLISALFLLILFPSHASPAYWEGRLDLFSLPFFAAGAIAISFGIRTLWRVRLGIAFLFLCMLAPMTPSIERLLGATGLPLPGTRSAVAYAILALALASFASGRFIVKALFVVAGVVIFLALALAADAALLVAGPQIALDGAPTQVLELVVLIVSAVISIGLLRVFRLHVSMAGLQRTPRYQVLRELSFRSPEARIAVPVAALMVVTLAVALALIAESSFPRYGAVLTDDGRPRLESGSIGRINIPGWSIQPAGSLAWTERYYGPGAGGNRYRLICTCVSAGSGSAVSSSSIFVDSIRSNQDRPLSLPEHALIHAIHGARLVSLTRVDLGGGVIGHAAVYRPQSAPDWIAIYWDWPVLDHSGARYEHMVVEASGASTEGLPVATAQGGGLQPIGMLLNDWLDGAAADPVGDASDRIRSGLTGIARAIVAGVESAATVEGGA